MNTFLRAICYLSLSIIIHTQLYASELTISEPRLHEEAIQVSKVSLCKLLELKAFVQFKGVVSSCVKDNTSFNSKDQEKNFKDVFFPDYPKQLIPWGDDYIPVFRSDIDRIGPSEREKSLRKQSKDMNRKQSRNVNFQESCEQKHYKMLYKRTIIINMLSRQDDYSRTILCNGVRSTNLFDRAESYFRSIWLISSFYPNTPDTEYHYFLNQSYGVKLEQFSGTQQIAETFATYVLDSNSRLKLEAALRLYIATVIQEILSKETIKENTKKEQNLNPSPYGLLECLNLATLPLQLKAKYKWMKPLVKVYEFFKEKTASNTEILHEANTLLGIKNTTCSTTASPLSEEEKENVRKARLARFAPHEIKKTTNG